MTRYNYIIVFLYLILISFLETNFFLNNISGIDQIRHLAWDLGYGFEIKTANFSGIIVIIFSLAFTTIFWLVARGLI